MEYAIGQTFSDKGLRQAEGVCNCIELSFRILIRIIKGSQPSGSIKNALGACMPLLTRMRKVSLQRTFVVSTLVACQGRQKATGKHNPDGEHPLWRVEYHPCANPADIRTNIQRDWGINVGLPIVEGERASTRAKHGGWEDTYGLLSSYMTRIIRVDYATRTCLYREADGSFFRFSWS